MDKRTIMQISMLNDVNVSEVYKNLDDDNKELFNNIKQYENDMSKEVRNRILKTEEKINSIFKGLLHETILRLENEVLESDECKIVSLSYCVCLLKIDALKLNLKVFLGYLKAGVPESEWKTNESCLSFNEIRIDETWTSKN